MAGIASAPTVLVRITTVPASSTSATPFGPNGVAEVLPIAHRQEHECRAGRRGPGGLEARDARVAGQPPAIFVDIEPVNGECGGQARGHRQAHRSESEHRDDRTAGGVACLH
jgi:hypothetical protein